MRLVPSVRYLSQQQRMLINQSCLGRGGAKVRRERIWISSIARVRLLAFRDMTWHLTKRDVFTLPYNAHVVSAFLIYYSSGSLIIFSEPTRFYRSASIIKV